MTWNDSVAHTILTCTFQNIHSSCSSSAMLWPMSPPKTRLQLRLFPPQQAESLIRPPPTLSRQRQQADPPLPPCCYVICAAPQDALEPGKGTADTPFPYGRGSLCKPAQLLLLLAKRQRGSRAMGVTLLRAGSPGTISSHPAQDKEHRAGCQGSSRPR